MEYQYGWLRPLISEYIAQHILLTSELVFKKKRYKFLFQQAYFENWPNFQKKVEYSGLILCTSSDYGPASSGGLIQQSSQGLPKPDALLAGPLAAGPRGQGRLHRTGTSSTLSVTREVFRKKQEYQGDDLPAQSWRYPSGWSPVDPSSHALACMNLLCQETLSRSQSWKLESLMQRCMRVFLSMNF